MVNDCDGLGSETKPNPALRKLYEAKSAGGKAGVNRASIADLGGAQSSIDDALKCLGRPDTVVNNAGILRERIFHKISSPNGRDVVNVHLSDYFYVAKIDSIHFKGQNSGSYLNFTSKSGLIGNLGQVNYAAANVGIVGLSTSIIGDLAPALRPGHQPLQHPSDVLSWDAM